MPQGNADPAFLTPPTPPRGLRVNCLNTPLKADKYRKIHTRSFSGYDQQLPNNLGVTEEESAEQTPAREPSKGLPWKTKRQALTGALTSATVCTVCLCLLTFIALGIIICRQIVHRLCCVERARDLRA